MLLQKVETELHVELPHDATRANAVACNFRSKYIFMHKL